MTTHDCPRCGRKDSVTLDYYQPSAGFEPTGPIEISVETACGCDLLPPELEALSDEDALVWAGDFDADR